MGLLGVMATVIALDTGLEHWRAVNDGVMGGVSSGRMVETQDGLRFEGELSLENNGGFASVRRLVMNDLAAARGVRLELRGDGRSYQFRLRAGHQFDGIAWSAAFTTNNDWQTVELDFDEFQPVFRGRIVPEAGPVNAAEIRQVGFLLADKQAGAFAIDIRSIEFIGD
jgi:monofunctional biosynthetic peptidoglycan transglycosylase